MNKRVFLSFLVSFLLLSACSVLPQAPKRISAPIKDWKKHKTTVEGMQSWHMTGKVAVQMPTGNSGTLSVDWQQRNQSYVITLHGMLGQGGIRLVGDEHGATLTTQDGQHFRASSPEVLLTDEAGWTLPFGYLNYWIRGIGKPGEPAKIALNINKQIISLTQAGWHVNYSEHGLVDSILLPHYLDMRSGDFEAKLVIKKWQL